MYAWNQLGRRVNKGEKGIRILAPMIGIRRKKDSEAEKDMNIANCEGKRPTSLRSLSIHPVRGPDSSQGDHE